MRGGREYLQKKNRREKEKEKDKWKKRKNLVLSFNYLKNEIKWSRDDSIIWFRSLNSICLSSIRDSKCKKKTTWTVEQFSYKRKCSFLEYVLLCCFHWENMIKSILVSSGIGIFGIADRNHGIRKYSNARHFIWTLL